MFPNYDVKNRVKLDFPLDAELTALIDDYLFNYRPALVADAKNPWLFPGAGESHKLLTTLSDQITSFIEKSIGLRLTVHQFRHLSAAIILKHQPGNYETRPPFARPSHGAGHDPQLHWSRIHPCR